MIGAGVITLIEDSFPGSFSIKINFLDALYFVIVTSSTIGYGDITPIRPFSRMAVVLIILTMIYVISNNIRKLVVLLSIVKKQSPKYNFENHTIIIGVYDSFKLNKIIYDMHESNNDTKCILVIINHIQSQVFNRLLLNDNNLLMKNVFYYFCGDLDMDALQRINILQSREIYFINQSNNINNDRLIGSYIKHMNTLLSYWEESNVRLFISYCISNEAYFFNHVHTEFYISSMDLKHSIIAKSLFCPGFSVFIYTLIKNLKVKQISNEKNENNETSVFDEAFSVDSKNFINIKFNSNYLNIYQESMFNEIDVINIPKCLFGLRFHLITRLIYKISLAIQIREKKNHKKKSFTSDLTTQHTFGIILIGLVSIFNEDAKLEKIIKSIHYDVPSNYVINESDRGIILTLNNQAVKTTLNFIINLDLKISNDELESLLQQSNNDTLLQFLFKLEVRSYNIKGSDLRKSNSINSESKLLNMSKLNNSKIKLLKSQKTIINSKNNIIVPKSTNNLPYIVNQIRIKATKNLNNKRKFIKSTNNLLNDMNPFESSINIENYNLNLSNHIIIVGESSNIEQLVSKK